MRVMRTSVDKSLCYIILPCVDEVKETSKFVGAFINRDNRLKDIIVNRKDSHRLVVEEGDKDFKIKDAEFMWERIYNSFDTFMEKYWVLKEFYEQFGRFPKQKESFNGYNIGQWLSHLKQKKNELKAEQVQLLDGVDPSWKDAKKKTLSFEEICALLKEFHEKESRLPTCKESFNGYNIGPWLARLKQKKNELKAERVKLLDDIDPSWKDAKILSFEENFALLKEFHEKESRLPKHRESFNGYNIGQWLANLKQRKNELKAEQVKSLNSIDPSWKDAKMKILSFEENFALLKEFHEKESRLPTQKESFNGYNIGQWLSHLKNRKNEWKAEQVKSLNSIDPSWKDAKMKILSFEENFALLKEFHEKESRLPTSKESFNGYNIGRWLSHLKNKKNELKAEQVQLLDGVDPSWKDINRKTLSFEENFALLKEFHEKESRLPTRRESFNGYNIGQWLANLKNKKNELKVEQVKSLNSIDPSWKDMKTRRGIQL
jgi:DNA-directed RNA polymerase subunit H (RpoH/RPB5)